MFKFLYQSDFIPLHTFSTTITIRKKVRTFMPSFGKEKTTDFSYLEGNNRISLINYKFNYVFLISLFYGTITVIPHPCTFLMDQ